MPEVVLVEFVGDSRSGVAAAEAQVAANRQLAASAKAATASGVTANRTLSASMAATGAAATKMGKAWTRSVSVPIAALGAVSGKMSLDFGRSMGLISTQAGGTRKEVEHLSKAILDLTAKGRYEQGPQELSEALFHIESVGIRGAKALRTLGAASDFASVGEAELEGTTNALLGAMKTGIKGTETLRKTIGTLNAVIGAGNLRMDDLTAAMGTGFLVAAKQVGLSLGDAGAALAELTAQGVPAAAAATRLRMTFTLMAAPTEKAQKALKGIGLDQESLAAQMQKPGGLVKALELLKEHMEGLTKIQQTQLLAEAFGGARSGTTIMALVGNLDDLGKKYREVGENAGNFGQKLRETREDADFEWGQTVAALKAALIEIGNEVVPVVIPVLKDLAATFGDIAHAFSALPEGTRKWVVGLGLAAVAFGPILRGLGGIISLAGKAAKALGLLEVTTAAGGAAAGAGAAAPALATPLSAAALASVAAAAGLVVLYAKSKAFREEVDKLAAAVKKSFGEVAKEVGLLVRSFVHLGNGEVFRNVFVKTFKVVFEQARNIIRGLGKTFSGELQVIRGIVDLFASLLKGDFGGVWRAVKTIFKGGVKSITGILGSLSGQIRPILGAVGDVFSTLFSGIWEDIKGIFTDGINSVIGFINDLIDVINVIPGIPDIGRVGEVGSKKAPKGPPGPHGPIGKGKHRARGGSIFEGAPSGDSVPALLERGEYVLNRKAVQKVGKGTLDAINFHEAPRFAFGGSVGDTLSGALGALPTPHLPKWIAGLGTYLLGQVKDYITSGFQEKKLGKFQGFGPTGVGTYKGVPMANWVIEALQYAAGKGVAPQPTSGYRSHAQNVAEGRNYVSEHEKTQYPGGAVDFGGMIDPASLPKKMAVVRATSNFRYPLLAPIGFRDDGHASGTGYRLGGFIAMSTGGPAPPKGGELVGASYYGGPTDSTSGTVGAAGVSLPGKMSFAELAMGKALGGLPFHTKLKIGYAGRSVIAEKLDIGLGGDSVNGRNRAIDLWYETAQAIGMPGLAVVKVSPVGAGASAVGRTPMPKQITGKYPAHPAGSTGRGGGTYGQTVRGPYKVQTGSLSFGSLPNSTQGCTRELAELRDPGGMLSEYQAAYRQTKDPETKRALAANIKAIRKRIRELVRQRAKLARQKKAARIGRRGVFPDIETAVEAKQIEYEQRSEYADQISALEPEENAASYITGSEAPAWASVLGAEASWRNTILGGEEVVRARINALHEQIVKIKELPPKALQKQKWRIAPLRKAIAAARGVFDPGKDTGTLPEALANVQGRVSSRSPLYPLPSDPVPGTFGGLIFDTQMTIRDLDLKLKQPDGGTEDNAALLDALRAQAEQARKEKALAEAQYGPLAQFLKAMPPYIGAFARGGTIPGRASDAYMATVHGGETIVPASANLGPVHFHISGEMAQFLDVAAPGLAKTIDERMGTKYRHLAYGPGGRG